MTEEYQAVIDRTVRKAFSSRGQQIAHGVHMFDYANLRETGHPAFRGFVFMIGGKVIVELVRSGDVMPSMAPEYCVGKVLYDKAGDRKPGSLVEFYFDTFGTFVYHRDLPECDEVVEKIAAILERKII